MTRTLHPASLQAYINNTYLDEAGEPKKSDLIYIDSALRQATWVRDALGANVCRGVDYKQYEDGAHVKVIAEHKSKSCPLPVYSLEPPGKGIRFILRGNFYNWKVSVVSDKPIDINPTGLFRGEPPAAPEYAGDDLHPVYFEGFPEDLIFGYYSTSDRKHFSAQVGSDEEVWSFVFLCLQAHSGAEWWEAQRASDEALRVKEAEYLVKRKLREAQRTMGADLC